MLDAAISWNQLILLALVSEGSAYADPLALFYTLMSLKAGFIFTVSGVVLIPCRKRSPSLWFYLGAFFSVLLHTHVSYFLPLERWALSVTADQISCAEDVKIW